MIGNIAAYKSGLAVIAGSTLAASAVLAEITADSILPLFALASGGAVGVIYLRYSVSNTATQKRIEHLESLLDDETEAHDRTRDRLAVLKDAVSEAGVRIHDLESEGNERHLRELPKPSGPSPESS